MRIFPIIFALILSVTNLYCQDDEMPISKPSTSDSIAISNYFNQFIIAIEKGQRSKILDLCLDKIECAACTESINETDYFIPKDKFYDKSLAGFKNSSVYKALKKRNFRVNIMTLKNYRPLNVPKNYSKDLILYEIWIQTFLPNEWAKGHEGQSNAFQFIKISNEYKLFGITSVP